MNKDRRKFLKKTLKYSLAVPPVSTILGTTFSLGLLGKLIFSKNSLEQTPKKQKKVVTESIKLNGSNIKMLGVSHINGFYEYNIDIFDNFISSCDIIVSETSPNISYSNSNRDFYTNLYHSIANKGKDIIICDPRSSNLQGVIMTTAMESLFPFLYYPSLKKLEEVEITKFEVIKRAVCYYLASFSHIGGIGLELILNPDKKLGYSTYDYSNVVVSSKVDNLTDKYRNIGIIYGSCHIPDFKYYLENPIKRKVKISTYKPLEFLCGLPDTRYGYNNGWKEICS